MQMQAVGASAHCSTEAMTKTRSLEMTKLKPKNNGKPITLDFSGEKAKANRQSGNLETLTPWQEMAEASVKQRQM